MRGFLSFAVAMACAGSALAQVQPPTPPGPVACKPCWIEPWYCKAPPCPPAPTKPAPQPDLDQRRPALVHETLTGIVKSLGVVQEEPAETPQAVFYLTVQGPDGRAADVLVSMPAMSFHCLEGQRATLEGDVSAGDKDLPTILMSARLVSCGSAPELR